MKKIVLILTFALAYVGVAVAQSQTKYIGMKKARAIASKTVDGEIKSGEREKEHGKMIYSFDIKGADGKNHEINIDAITGEVIANTAESAADEAKEKAEDKAAKKKYP